MGRCPFDYGPFNVPPVAGSTKLLLSRCVFDHIGFAAPPLQVPRAAIRTVASPPFSLTWLQLFP